MSNCIYRVCDLYWSTVKKHKQHVAKAFELMRAKCANPSSSVNSKDTAFTANGPIGKLGKGIMHVHLTRDLSLVYAVHSKPSVIDLYGIFPHKELGTGDTPNIRKQQAMATKFNNQQFTNFGNTK